MRKYFDTMRIFYNNNVNEDFCQNPVYISKGRYVIERIINWL